MEASFTVRDLTFTYAGQTRPALTSLSLDVPRGSFFVLCGSSGCGKSTLLRHLKPGMEPSGTRSGTRLFCGKPFNALSEWEKSAKIGFVRQNTENSIVTDRVWHELAFGLESLGFDSDTVRRCTAETASFFGMEAWYDADTASLSGGQRQLLSLASVMAMQPETLLLDEPTAQLDPIAAADFMAALGKVNRELGTTVLLTEHRLEEAFPYAQYAAVMENGTIRFSGETRAVCAALAETDHPMLSAMPAAVRMWAGAGGFADKKDAEADPAETGGEDRAAGSGKIPVCPVTVGEGRIWFSDFAGRNPLRPLPGRPVHNSDGETALCAEGVWFRYAQDAPDVLRNLNVSVKRGEILALLGGNGTGKSTLLKVLSSVEKPQRGTVLSSCRIGMLPQDPQTLFSRNTVGEEISEVLKLLSVSGDERERRFSSAVSLCRLEEITDRHPYDLSGGEQQRAALGKLLAADPEVLLLDEPTKGLDVVCKARLAKMLEDLTASGKAVLLVSHDIEFCAEYAHRCALFFNGAIVSEGEPREFFAGSRFYTTAANRIAREYLPSAVTPDELIAVCGGTPERVSQTEFTEGSRIREGAETAENVKGVKAEEKRNGGAVRLSRARRLCALGCALLFVLSVLAAVLHTDLSSVTAVGAVSLSPLQWVLCGTVFLSLAGFALSVGAGRNARVSAAGWEREKPGKRSVAAAVLILLCIPVTVFLGLRFFGARRYYLTLLIVLAECMLPLFVLFEGRRPRAREIVLLSVLCAVGTAGRAVFFMLPQFKPVIALTILAGAALGAESGFLVGAFTMLISNMLFSQGPWTVWQMFAMGLIGFLSGLLFRRRPGRAVLCGFGAFASIVLYGGIMNPAAALLWSGAEELSLSVLVTYWLTGFPVDCVQAAATVLFLWFGAEPMLDRLSRVRMKYAEPVTVISGTDKEKAENDEGNEGNESRKSGNNP